MFDSISMTLTKQQTTLLIISHIGSWILLLSILIIQLLPTSHKNLEQLTVRQINIVNEDGVRVMAISNKQKVAPPVMDGKEYPIQVAEGREYMAGMIFFNEEGDEMGGLVFNSFRLPNGRSAGIGHLSFDRFKDNQVMALQYKENRAGVQSGLTVYDRPGDGIFSKSLDLLAEAYANNTSAMRLTEIRDSISMLSASRQLGGDRLFIGNKNAIPQLTMKDDLGNVRIKLFVDSLNQAQLQFMDDQGELIASFPEY